MALRDTTKIKGSLESKPSTTPETLLWLSVLELAVSDYIQGLITGSHTDDFRSAREWIYGENQNYPNSFESICLLLGFNPETTRKALQTDPVNIKLRLAGKSKKRELHVR